MHTISGGIDESWFYLITVAIESVGRVHTHTRHTPYVHAVSYSVPALTYLGAASLQCMIDAIQALDSDDWSALSSALATIADAVRKMTDTLMRMPENCDPYIFYHRVRIYFSGWSNMKDLPDGLLYEGA